MSNCKHLKLKLNRTCYCNLMNKKITWSECKNCKLREFNLTGLRMDFFSPSKSNEIQNSPSMSVPPKKKKKPKIDISTKTRRIVNERDSGICQLCGHHGVQLHHIKYRSERKDLIDEPSNLISLCFNCHQLVHTNKKKYQPMLLDIIQCIKKEEGN